MSLYTRLTHAKSPAFCKSGWFFFACCGLAALKLLIISQNEVYLSSGDNLAYVFYADHGYWGTPFLPDRPPLFSLWMAAAHALGVRFRFLQELLYIASASVAVFALRRCRVPRPLVLAFFAAVLFAPIATYHLDFAMADGFYISLNLFTLSFMVLGLLARRFLSLCSWSFTVGIAVAAMVHTRMEIEYVSSLLTCFLAIIALLRPLKSPGKAMGGGWC